MHLPTPTAKCCEQDHRPSGAMIVLLRCSSSAFCCSRSSMARRLFCNTLRFSSVVLLCCKACFACDAVIVPLRLPETNDGKRTPGRYMSVQLVLNSLISLLISFGRYFPWHVNCCQQSSPESYCYIKLVSCIRYELLHYCYELNLRNLTTRPVDY